MTSLSRNARIAGLLYLTLLTAPLRLIYIPSKRFVTGNATATANNIAAHEMLFRLGILSDLFTAIFLTLALYRLFKGSGSRVGSADGNPRRAVFSIRAALLTDSGKTRFTQTARATQTAKLATTWASRVDRRQ